LLVVVSPDATIADTDADPTAHTKDVSSCGRGGLPAALLAT
jgi:hypothetical protein